VSLIRYWPFFFSRTASTKTLNLVKVLTCCWVFLIVAASAAALPKNSAPRPSWELTRILYLLLFPAVEASLQSSETCQIKSPPLAPLAGADFLVVLLYERTKSSTAPSTFNTEKVDLKVEPEREPSWWKRSLREVVGRVAHFLSTSETTTAWFGTDLVSCSAELFHSSLTFAPMFLARREDATKLRMLE